MPEHFRENLRYTVDHLRRVTRGKSEVLLFTCFKNPGRARHPGRVRTGPPARWRRKSARAWPRISHPFTEWATKPELVPWLYAWDGHLTTMGHTVVAEEAWEAINSTAVGEAYG